MSDLIKREDAIKALGDAHFLNWGYAVMVIQDLPSVDSTDSASVTEDAMPYEKYCRACGSRNTKRMKVAGNE